MSSRRRHLVTIFSLLLWAQLIFSVGLMGWRYWAVFWGQFEVFVGTSPAQTNPLIELSRKHCEEESPIFYIGRSEPDYFFVRYQLFPHQVVGLLGDWPADLGAEDVEKRLQPILKNSPNKSCIMVDRVLTMLPTLGARLEVNSNQYLIVVQN